MYQLLHSLIFSIALSVVSIAHAAIPIEERNALIAFYHATGGDNWKDNTGWLGEKGSECTWYGVACYFDELRVKKLNLANNNLTGNIPIELVELSELIYLNLRNNQLIGSPSKKINKISALFLDDVLWRNMWQKEKIIERNALITFYYATDGDNWRNNTDWLNEQVDECDWFGVECFRGRVDILDLTGNKLSGRIPEELGQLSELWKLVLGDNQLTGSVPKELELLRLIKLDLSNNQLTGNIPRLAPLKDWNPNNDEGIHSIKLFLNDNQFSGSLPRELVQEPGYLDYILNVGGNCLTLDTPDSFFVIDAYNASWKPERFLPQLDCTNLPIITEREQERNALIALYHATGGDNWKSNTGWLGKQGSECQWVGVSCESGWVKQLNLIDNQLSGHIPKELGQLSRLHFLRLSDNQLTGTIPKELGQLRQLMKLFLRGNQLTGSIPKELGLLHKLWQLNLSDNRLIGDIPKELGQLSELRGLFLSNNQLVGNIPKELAKLSRLGGLWVSHNQLTGSIPKELVKSLTHFIDTTLQVDHNFLTLDSPDSLLVIDSYQGEVASGDAIFLPQKNYAINLPTLSDRGLFITIPELSLSGKFYKALLKPYRMESDPEGFYWQLISATEITAREGVAVVVQENFDILFKSIVVGGDILSTSLEFYTPEIDSKLLVWKWGELYSIP